MTSAPLPDTPARLLQQALRLFSERGFANTSVRDIAQAAEANLAAVSYHFRDKAGLYRAVFDLQAGEQPLDPQHLADPTHPLPQAIHTLMRGFLAPLADGEQAWHCIRLYFRELVEPTGLLPHPPDHELRQLQEALLLRLQHEWALTEADAGLRALALAVLALPVQCFVCRDLVLLQLPDIHTQGWAHHGGRLTAQALDLIDAEARRRGLPPVVTHPPHP